VVLHHTGIQNPHFDLMLETSEGSALATWRADSWPLQNGTPMEHIAAHRRDFLEFQGPLTGNRGEVRRVAAGTHFVEQDHPVLLIVRLEDASVLRLFRTPKSAAQVLRA
jgi:hypothetical protein